MRDGSIRLFKLLILKRLSLAAVVMHVHVTNREDIANRIIRTGDRAAAPDAAIAHEYPD